jgi:carboxymethylenebutenolidase
MTHSKLLPAAIALIWMSGSVALAAPTTAPSADTAQQQLKNSPRHGEWVDVPMPGSDVKIRTWVVYPETKDKAPVVLVIHEIFGLSDWVRAVADQLAAEGFIAVAPDFLSGMGPNGGGTESLGDGVGQAIRKITPDEQVKRLDAVRDWALAQPSANGKSGSVGFCWGGSASFNYAAHQSKLNGAVVYYGTAPMKERAPDLDLLSNVPCPVLGNYGGADNRVTSTVEATRTSMLQLKKPYTANVYEGAGHGFLRQQNGQNGANQKAADQAWAATIEFFKKNLSESK